MTDEEKREVIEKITGPSAETPIRKKILEETIRVVCGDRDDKYGKPEKSLGEIANLWSVYLGVPITAKDASVMMCLFKIARIKTGVNKNDNYVDACGYMATAGELESEEELFLQQISTATTKPKGTLIQKMEEKFYNERKGKTT